ncbi:enoyl-CoA hydratase/isomerase family protein [Kribbella sp. NPDC056861]|uniref:enoyl-CoA hydratase/isomerase family protein n=1 Tax=Kribbella sp. NPDC056861 TaxID=3154857 RepID=UPI00343D180F
MSICDELAAHRDNHQAITAAYAESEQGRGRSRDVNRMLVAHRTRGDELYSVRAATIYAELTEQFTVRRRLGELLALATDLYPGLLPDRLQLSYDRQRMQQHKLGLEFDHGLLASWWLDDAVCGAHLIDSMTAPLPKALVLLNELREFDQVDLGVVRVERNGVAGEVTLQNHAFLNAEDVTSVRALELAVDLVLLDDRIEIGVLRGAPATHPKYAGRRVFSSGLNLTHLVQGRIPLVDFFLNRELGAMNKILRGHPVDGPSGGPERRHEKPWIGALETFAIGGGCQILLVCDQVIGETGSYFSLPAGREGIIPGLGGMRLARVFGDAQSRLAVTTKVTYPADSPLGRQLVGTVVEPAEMTDAIAACVAEQTEVGAISARANRRAMRIAAEPVDLLRRCLANYTRDQAECLFDPALTGNLHRIWRRSVS